MPTLRLVTLAAVAGIIVGSTALYVMGGLNGNQPVEIALSQDTATCPLNRDKVAAVTPYIKGDVAALLPAESAQSVTDLRFNGPDGVATSLENFTGKVTLLNLWATWCAPCRDEMPALDQLQAELGSDNFEVVAVNIDRGDDVKPKTFLEEIGVQSLGYYRDESTNIFNELRRRNLAVGLPVTLLIDDEGCVLAHMNGPAHWSSSDAVKLIKAATAKPEI